MQSTTAITSAITEPTKITVYSDLGNYYELKTKEGTRKRLASQRRAIIRREGRDREAAKSETSLLFLISPVLQNNSHPLVKV